MTTVPIACTLTSDELRLRQHELLPGLVATALQRVQLPEGMRLVFGASAGRLRQLHAVAQRERRCCAFLEFRIEVTPGGGALTLDVTGPRGTAAFLESLAGMSSAA